MLYIRFNQFCPLVCAAGVEKRREAMPRESADDQTSVTLSSGNGSNV